MSSVDSELADSELARRSRQVFRAALEHEPAERGAFLDQACPSDTLRKEVESLLEYDRKSEVSPGGTLIRGKIGASLREIPAGKLDGGPSPGTRIGAWRILDRLGQGGMGTVHLVERADGAFEQRAALKLIRPAVWNTDLGRRLESERQILAHLRHPHIAGLLDGGTTADGRPYLVMELIDGRPIDRYCDDRRLSVRQRLELFVQVCLAVEHAHRALIVHRDLKPSNVVVDDEGRVILLDFGIARALDAGGASSEPLTEATARAMTPDYASPEQVLGQVVTTVTDVYQLGLLLFELLTGQRAQKVEGLSPGALERAICETPIASASAVVAAAADPESCRARCSTRPALARRLRGDLDHILGMALRKEPERRYGSVARLHEDIDRHLRGLPIRARGDSVGYRLRRFVGRHRQALALAALGLALAVWMMVQSGLNRVRVLREAERVRQIESVVESLFEYPRISESGREPQLVDFVDLATDLIRQELREQPAIQARLLDRLGRTYSALGAYRRSVQTLTEALALIEPSGDPSRSNLLVQLGRNQHFVGLLADAEASFRRASSLREQSLGDSDPQTVAAKLELADLLHSRGRLRDAETLLEATALSLQAVGEGRELLELRARGYLANVLRDRGSYDRAEATYRVTLSGVIDLLGERDMLAMTNSIYLARLLVIRGRLDEAERRLGEQLRMLDEVYFGKHPLTAVVLRELAFVAIERGQRSLAEDRLAAAREVTAEWLDADHPTVPRITALQAELERRRGEVDKAIEVSRATLEHFARLGLRGHPSALDTCITLGLALRESGVPAGPGDHLHLAECLDAAERELVAGDLRIKRLRELRRHHAQSR